MQAQVRLAFLQAYLDCPSHQPNLSSRKIQLLPVSSLRSMLGSPDGSCGPSSPGADHLSSCPSICCHSQVLVLSLPGSLPSPDTDSPKLTGHQLPMRLLPLSHSLMRLVTHRVTWGRTERWKDGQTAQSLKPCCLVDPLLRLGHLYQDFLDSLLSISFRREICKDV